MPDVTASRTLVKSAPELWTECSDADSLGRHLERFGEIRITRLEPETTVAWEGERASGTVMLEPSGWGTRVVLTATPAPSPNKSREPVVAVAVAQEAAPTPAPVAPEPEAGEPVAPDPGPLAPRPGFLARLFVRFRRAEAPVAQVVDPPETPEPEEPEPIPVQPEPEPVRLVPEELPAPPEDPVGELDPESVLNAALDSLGQAHHRPFSRA